MKNLFLLLIGILVVLVSCEKQTQEKAERGYIISQRHIRDYSPEEIEAIMLINKFDIPFELEHNVKSIKIAYMTPEPDGDLVNATGGIFIPQTEGEFPVILFQHATQTQRHLVPSLGAGNSDAGLAGAIAASMGYVCIAADYLGLGESYITAPFLLAENSATTVVDMLDASYRYLEENGIKTDGSVYLTGYSQGAHVTLATLRELEQNYSEEHDVSAAAVLGGPYDLAGMIDSILLEGWFKEPILFAYLMNSYDHYYGWNRLNDFFQEPYASSVPGFFDGTRLFNSIRKALPQSLDSLLTDDFRNSYKSGTETDFVNALRENSLLNYKPEAPLLIVHGKDDVTVPMYNAGKLLSSLVSNGKTNVILDSIEGNHEGAAKEAIIKAMLYFESIRNSP